MKKSTLLIFDTTNIFIRSFSGLMRHGLTAPDGTGTWGTFGTFNTVANLVRKYEPSHLLLAFDKGKSSKRLAIDPEYKANRDKKRDKPKPMEEAFSLEFKPQLEMFLMLCSLNGLPFLRIQGVEADDIIAHAALSLSPVFDRVVIVSADHDLHQLIRPNIIVVKPNISFKDIEEEVHTMETIMDTWGVEPWRLPEIWSLMGDTGDNIKGINGIGPKKATKLIAEHGDLEAVLSLDDTKIQENIEVVRKAKKLIELSTDNSIDFPPLGNLQFNPMKYGDPGYIELENIYDQLGFTQIKDRWRKNILWSDGLQFGKRLNGH